MVLDLRLIKIAVARQPSFLNKCRASGTCFSFVKALTLRFIYRKSSLLLLVSNADSLADVLARFHIERQPAQPRYPRLVSAGRRRCLLCLCEPAQAKDGPLQVRAVSNIGWAGLRCGTLAVVDSVLHLLLAQVCLVYFIE